jgi:hypothetical protein
VTLPASSSTPPARDFAVPEILSSSMAFPWVFLEISSKVEIVHRL